MSDPSNGAYEFVGEFHQKTAKAASSQNSLDRRARNRCHCSARSARAALVVSIVLAATRVVGRGGGSVTESARTLGAWRSLCLPMRFRPPFGPRPRDFQCHGLFIAVAMLAGTTCG